MPLVIATGAGAGSRRSMGTGVFGGMLAATFIAPIFIPMFFTLLARQPKPKEIAEQKREVEAAHKAMHANDNEIEGEDPGVGPGILGADKPGTDRA